VAAYVGVLAVVANALRTLPAHRGETLEELQVAVMVASAADPPVVNGAARLVSVSVAGAPVAEIIPFSVGETGNLTVHVVAPSSAGTLTVTVVADPDRCPGDLSVRRSGSRAVEPRCRKEERWRRRHQCGRPGCSRP